MRVCLFSFLCFLCDVLSCNLWLLLCVVLLGLLFFCWFWVLVVAWFVCRLFVVLFDLLVALGAVYLLPVCFD